MALPGEGQQRDTAPEPLPKVNLGALPPAAPRIIPKTPNSGLVGGLASDAAIPLAGKPTGAAPSAPQRTDDDPNVGRRVGPYIIERLLARGGMGAVYYAMDGGLRRPVALKLMVKDLLGDEDALRRFQREARASASVSHPNIALVYLVGLADDGSPFLSMEFLDGGSLLDFLRERRSMALSQAADYFIQAAEGLRAARKQGIIHRDIKPGNMMLTKEGVLKLVDFGLAKVMFDDNYKTMEGTILGTPKYMSPEQGQGRGLDHRSDVYSLGATFYHLLTGRPPFDAESSVQIMLKHVTAPLVPMRTLNPAIPIEFDAIIARCMRKDPNDRYDDYAELISDLKALKLQLLALEQGDVIDAAGTASALNAQPVATRIERPEPSATAPAPPRLSTRTPLPVSGPPSVHSTVGPAIAPGATSYEELPEPSLSMVQKLLIALAALAVIAFAVWLALPKGSSAEDGETADAAPSAQDTPLDRLIANLDSRIGGPGTDPNFLAYRATREILENLGAGMLPYQAAHSAYPDRLTQLIEGNHVTVIWNATDSGAPLDGWGRRIEYRQGTGEIRSPGYNGAPFDSDDIVYTEDGGLVVPKDYDRLEEEHEQRRRRQR